VSRVAEISPEAEDLAALIRRAQDGSEAALEILIARFQDRIAGFVYSLIGRDDAIEDLCHDIFIKMLSGLSGLKNPDAFEAWLFRIARNVAMDSLRRKRLWRMFVPFEPKHEQIAEAPRSGDSRVEEFRAALEGMPPNQKELILLLAENDWSYEQLAEITRSSVSAVKSRLFRAREYLRQRVADED
jgi:RNA polymerase sigma-70 factor (ECF subfamily)